MRRRVSVLVTVAALVVGVSVACTTHAKPTPEPVAHPSARVNPMVGTMNGGNTTPAASVPFGMMQFGPDTAADVSAGRDPGLARALTLLRK